MLDSSNLVHILPSTFYKKLVMVPEVGTPLEIQERNSSLSISEKRHARVTRWTRKINLIEQKLIVVPICENSHWFLVVMVMLGGKEPFLLVMDSMGSRMEAAVEIVKGFFETEKSQTPSTSVNRPIQIIYLNTPKQIFSESK